MDVLSHWRGSSSIGLNMHPALARRNLINEPRCFDCNNGELHVRIP